MYVLKGMAAGFVLVCVSVGNNMLKGMAAGFVIR